MSVYFEYLPFKISLLDFSVHFYFQNGHVMTSAANQFCTAGLSAKISQNLMSKLFTKMSFSSVHGLVTYVLLNLSRETASSSPLIYLALS